MNPKRPYLFYGQTQSLCETCLEVVPAKIIFQNNAVYYQKRCLEHGVQKTLVSTDIEYFKRCKDYIKPGDMPQTFQTRIQRGCPHDCGLCPDHEQHTCLALFEIIDECNMRCPVCFSMSAPGAGNARSMAEVEKMLSTLLASEIAPDLVQVSGGEPTLHPQIIDILKRLKNSPIKHLMLNTNGIRIAQDPIFVRALRALKPGFEVYLQFDSLRAESLKAIRGIDARRVRETALQVLEDNNISTTLVCVVRKGVNDGEIAEIIQYAKQWSCVRGITFQPEQDAGRNDGREPQNRITLSEVRQRILDEGTFQDADMVPLPCHPEHISIGYGLKSGSHVQPVTGLIPKDVFLQGAENTVAFERSEPLKQAFLDVFSLTACGEQTANSLQKLLCCLPSFEVPKSLNYDNIFRIVIMSFMDKYDFDLGSIKRSCVHFVEPDGKIYPFETFNLFYRGTRIRERSKRKRQVAVVELD